MSKILVVDDDPDFVEITRMVLVDGGYDVETASDGNMALSKLQKSVPDLVVLDIMMSGILDGVYVANQMSENVALRDVPVLMVSSITSSPMAGMFPTDEYLPIDGWLSKPVQPQTLLKKVASIVGA